MAPSVAALSSRTPVVAARAPGATAAGRRIVAAASPMNGDNKKASTPRTRGPARGGKQSLKAVIHPTDTPGGIGQLTPDMSPIVLHGNSTGVPITGVWQPETRCVLYTAELEQGSLYIGVDSTATQERPGNGGLRIRAYPTPAAAKQEAINLSEAMSFKHGVYNTGFSGAKLVFDTAVPVNKIDKEQLMDRVAEVLEALDARVYTGCDINTTDADMAYLDNISPFVLAGIGSEVDTNVATSAGAFAAVVKAVEHMGLPSDFKVLVQGAGKVGTQLAKSLVNIGATVYTYDVDQERANIPGCTNVSDVEDWASLDIDVFSPNAVSGVITVDVANRMKCKAVVGAANVPFINEEARLITNSRGIIFVPEYITSAGAIIVDSLEWSYDDFDSCTPALAYEFVYDTVFAKVGVYLEALEEASSKVLCHKELTASVSDLTLGETVVGSKMNEFSLTASGEIDTEKWSM